MPVCVQVRQPRGFVRIPNVTSNSAPPSSARAEQRRAALLRALAAEYARLQEELEQLQIIVRQQQKLTRKKRSGIR